MYITYKFLAFMSMYNYVFLYHTISVYVFFMTEIKTNKQKSVFITNANTLQ